LSYTLNKRGLVRLKDKFSKWPAIEVRKYSWIKTVPGRRAPSGSHSLARLETENC